VRRKRGRTGQEKAFLPVALYVKILPDLDIEANLPTMKIVKMAKCRYSVGDEYVWKIFWLKEDGVWYKEPGISYATDMEERRAKMLGAEILKELPDDAVTDNPARDREYLLRLRTTKIEARRSMSIYAPERDDTQKWEIHERDLHLVSRMQGFLRGSPSQNYQGYCTVEILIGSDADRFIQR
jgi:hypothetical protein